MNQTCVCCRRFCKLPGHSRLQGSREARGRRSGPHGLSRNRDMSRIRDTPRDRGRPARLHIARPTSGRSVATTPGRGRRRGARRARVRPATSNVLAVRRPQHGPEMTSTTTRGNGSPTSRPERGPLTPDGCGHRKADRPVGLEPREAIIHPHGQDMDPRPQRMGCVPDRGGSAVDGGWTGGIGGRVHRHGSAAPAAAPAADGAGVPIVRCRADLEAIRVSSGAGTADDTVS